MSGSVRTLNCPSSRRAFSVGFGITISRQAVKLLGVAQDQTGRTYCGIANECGGIGWSAMDDSGMEGVGDERFRM